MPSSQRRRIDGAFKAPQRNAALHGTKTEGDVDVDDGSVADLMEKDDTEKELERLVFGDQAGFYEALKSHGRRDDELQLARRRSGEGEEDGLSGEEDGLDALDDADLFFLDSAPATLPEETLATIGSDGEDFNADYPRAAWEDSDDERITVSLANSSRLRVYETIAKTV
ncbi:hypothetical protein LPUS_07641 [Lasallia pustulata]|uniref:Uncharacterized protein n=1 Tax=Lasallia pustulata TaxID=136370 RepID=A0A1W5D3K0_9LECA|nr:hypothetical protein LPUS_07641 [Lasallia pustulata]